MEHTAFSKISKKRTTWRGIPKFSQFFSRKHLFFFHSTLLPEFLEFLVQNGSYFGNSTVSVFLELSVPVAAIFKFSKVLVEWKAPVTDVGAASF